jgi:cation diffusion facilitator CzcD-associated flavoprotein CzcO
MAPASTPPIPAPVHRDLAIVIVGAGFGGIAAAIELKRHGFQNITILDAASELGGTWFHNTYPGAACDVPSHLYSFSFAQRRDWSRLCSPQDEILRYLRAVASEHGVDRLIRANSEVLSCVWEEERSRWIVSTADGPVYEAGAIVLATGQLHQPLYPHLHGVEEFAGHAFHSARWDHAYSLRGKRVAVIGTGASAVQFVPELAREVEQLTVFQRTGNWFLPRKNRSYPPAVKALIHHLPGVQAFRRQFIFQYTETLTACIRHPKTLGRVLHVLAAAFMRRQLKDPALRHKAWPDYTIGCKRILFSSHYLPALQRPNVELVNIPIARIAPEGVLRSDGVLHEVDCLIYGTGFHTNRFMFPMEVIGRGGRSLREHWAEGAHAHLGMTVPGYPSMFVMYGPNTNTSGGSIVFYLEAQAAYLRQALELLLDRGATAIDVRAEVEAASDREIQARFPGTAWMDCQSWYRDGSGRIVANWPGYMREYLERTRALEASHFHFTFAAHPVQSTSTKEA